MYISNNVRLLRQWLIWLRGIIRLSHGIIVEQHLEGSVGLWDHPVMPRHHGGAAFGWVSWFVGSSGYATALLGAAFGCRDRWFCLVGLSSPLGAYY